MLRRRNATTLATFTVDGLVAGSWRAVRQRSRYRVVVEAFAPLPRRPLLAIEGERDALERFYNA